MALKISMLALIVGLFVCLHYPAFSSAAHNSQKHTPLGLPYTGNSFWALANEKIPKIDIYIQSRQLPSLTRSKMHARFRSSQTMVIS